MSHNFEIVFKRESSRQIIHRLPFQYEQNDRLHHLVELYGKQDIVFFLKEFLSSFDHPLILTTQEISSLGEDQLKEKIQQLLLDNSHLESAKKSLEDKISERSKSRANSGSSTLRDENARLNRQLLEEISRSNQYYRYYEDSNQYNNLRKEWSQLFPQFSKLDELARHIASLTEAKEKLQRSKQSSDQRFQEIEQELQETQQKLSLATMRLRSVNTSSQLAGGGSRSDQLKNEFFQLKTILHEVTTKVLIGWQLQGFKSSVKNDFRSEEFSRIKSVLSQRVFGDGMAYFVKDKTEVDAELHLVMDALSSIKDFSLTPAIFQEIQEKVQTGLLRSKSVDHSDEALIQYIEETTQHIDQYLQSIVNLSTTNEAINEIKKFIEVGLRIVRDIVNDPNSGELFIPENGTAFDDTAHDTRDDHKGQIKMTICAGYRIKGTVFVKADVMTYGSDATSPANEPDPINSQPTNPQNRQPEGEMPENKHAEDDTHKTERTGGDNEAP